MSYPVPVTGLVLLRTQERVRNSIGKRAISVRATEVLLYIKIETVWSDRIRAAWFINTRHQLAVG